MLHNNKHKTKRRGWKEWVRRMNNRWVKLFWERVLKKFYFIDNFFVLQMVYCWVVLVYCRVYFFLSCWLVVVWFLSGVCSARLGSARLFVVCFYFCDVFPKNQCNKLLPPVAMTRFIVVFCRALAAGMEPRPAEIVVAAANVASAVQVRHFDGTRLMGRVPS